jgi:hypothetical protein
MDWSLFTSPQVIAPTAGLVGVLVGAGISSWTTRKTHRERLVADQALAERKVDADIALAEKRLALDYELDIRKRRAVLAEEVLADFYEARDIFNAVRSPGNFSDEGSTRPKTEGESVEDTRILNIYFAAIERLHRKVEFFSKLYARRYRFIAVLGRDAARPYDDLFELRNEIVTAVDMLLITHRDRKTDSLASDMQEWQRAIWGGRREDPISKKLDSIVAAIEETCRPIIQAVVQ